MKRSKIFYRAKLGILVLAILAASVFVIAGTSAAVLGAFRGAFATARATRTGVLLRPLTATDGEVLGVRAQLGDRTGPGRGLLVVEGEQRALQVAH